MNLPFGPTVPHMLAKGVDAIPAGESWLYEPKWDGFRATVFFDGDEIFLQSRELKPLGRYFPELEAGLREVLPPRIVLDGEIVVATAKGLDFDALQMRIHPAESRVRMLAEQTPSSYVAFDLLALGGEDLRDVPFGVRRRIARRISTIRSACSSGSPSQPWPKESIARGADSRCGSAISSTSSTSGTKVSRSCGEGIGASGCAEMQPTHAALHAGASGIGHSQRS